MLQLLYSFYIIVTATLGGATLGVWFVDKHLSTGTTMRRQKVIYDTLKQSTFLGLMTGFLITLLYARMWS